MFASMREEAVRDGWEPNAPEESDEGGLDGAVFEHARRSAAKAGAAWFEAEFARREEEERRDREAVIGWRPGDVETVPELVDSSVEDDAVGGSPNGLGI
jgi:hypothetical protein